MARALSTIRAPFGAIILSLCIGARAFADPSPDVKKYLGSAAALFEKLEYEKALAQLKRAKAKSQGPEDDLKIALYEGIVLAEMGDATASAAFTTALGMDPTATLPMVVSPKAQRVFDKAKAQVQKVLEAQAELDRQKAEEKRKQEEASRPPPPPVVEPKPEPVVVHEPPKPRPSSGLRTFAWAPGAVGLIGVGVGTALLVEATGAHQKLVAGQPATGVEALALANSGATMQTAGWVLVGVGCAAVAAAGAMFLFGGSSGSGGPSVLVAPSPNGALVALTLGLP